jgi:endogenous inhibitor of DNA gyrase (YacG/DUF329 family)
MTSERTEPLPDCSDLLGCPSCGSSRVERFAVDRFEIFACAGCGYYDIETDLAEGQRVATPRDPADYPYDAMGDYAR